MITTQFTFVIFITTFILNSFNINACFNTGRNKINTILIPQNSLFDHVAFQFYIFVKYGYYLIIIFEIIYFAYYLVLIHNLYTARGKLNSPVAEQALIKT